MPVDLDEMFTALGRQADAIPLAPAAQARRRGRQRTRTRAMFSAAVAVGLIATGAGVAAEHGRTVDPVEPGHALHAVGPGVDFGGTAKSVVTAAVGDRVYTGWQAADGVTEVVATDLRTGAAVWRVRPGSGRSGQVLEVRALTQGVLVVLADGNGESPDATAHLLDPADGRDRWTLPIGAGDTLITHRSALVRASVTGRADAFDWATGTRRWSVRASAGQKIRTIGMSGPDDGDVSRLPAGLTDNRLVQVSNAGRVWVRDVDTGALIRTVTVGAVADLNSLVADDGRLFYEEGVTGSYRIQAADLRADDGAPAVVLTMAAGRRAVALTSCGTQRLCVADGDAAGGTAVTAIDVASRQQLWRVAGPDGGGTIDAVDGRTVVVGTETVVYDQNGAEVFRTSTATVQLDADTLLALPPGTAGPVSEVTFTDGRTTRLGEIPAVSGPCAWTIDRLACPTSTGLRIWSLTG